MLTGCEQNTTEVLPPNGEEPTEVLLSARIASVQVSTRANYDAAKTSFANGDQIGLFGWKTSIDDGNRYLDNVKLVSNDGGSSLTADGQKIYFPVQTRTLQLCAYYPYSDTEVSGTSIRIKSELDTSATGITDPLWGTTSVDKPTGSTPANASFTLEHRMSRLRIFVYQPEEAGTSYTLESIIVEFYHPQTGTMDLSTGAVTATSNNPTEYTDSYETSIPLPTTEPGDPQYDHTILPAEAVGGNSTVKKITLVVTSSAGAESDPQPQYEVYDAEAEGAPAIKPDHGHMVNVKVKFNPSTTASAGIGTWTEDGEVQL